MSGPLFYEAPELASPVALCEACGAALTADRRRRFPTAVTCSGGCAQTRRRHFIAERDTGEPWADRQARRTEARRRRRDELAALQDWWEAS